MRTGSDDDRPGERSGAVVAPDALTESRVGQIVGDRWRLESVIGVGGTASVYAARHRNGREAALKVLHPELARDARSRKRFLREAYAANRVGHSGAVSVIDDGEMPDGTPFLLLELISGRSLAEFMKDGSRLPVSDVVAIGVGILDVLAAAHDAGVVHRDIKPSNVIVTADRRIKLLDFGIAKFHDAADHDPLLTRSEASLGTPAFMSPEQSAGRSAEVDARSDLWSVGATLFSLLTGRFVHTGTSSNELLIASATVQAPSIATLREDLPPCVVSAIDRALLLDRAKRWPNARAMKATLMGMPDDDPASVITIAEESGRSGRRRRTVPLALMAGVLALLAALLWFQNRSDARREPSVALGEDARAPLPIPSVGGIATAAAVTAGDVAPAVVSSAAATAPHVVALPASRGVRSRVPSRPAAASAVPAAASAVPAAASAVPAASAEPASRRPDTLFDRRQ